MDPTQRGWNTLYAIAKSNIEITPTDRYDKIDPHEKEQTNELKSTKHKDTNNDQYMTHEIDMIVEETPRMQHADL